MTTYFARRTRNRGASYEALLVEQSRKAGVKLDDLREYDEAAQAGNADSVLVVADQPAPARGYALLVPVRGQGGGETVFVRMHVLENQADEVYQALFSAVAVQARVLLGDEPVRMELDAEALADYVAERVEALGEPYGVRLGKSTGYLSEKLAEQLSATGGVVVGGAAEPVEASVEQEQEPSEEAAAEEQAGEDEDAEPEELEESGEVRCGKCGKTFKSAQGLGAHSRAHK